MRFWLFSSHPISVPYPRRSSGHHRRHCNNTFPPFPVFRCPQEISKPHSRPFLDVIFPSLLLSSSPSCSFHCPLQNCLRQARGSWDVAIPSVSVCLPWWGDHHALQLHSGFCCEPPRSSHGLCRKCSEVSYSISSQELGSFSRFLLSRSSSLVKEVR